MSPAIVALLGLTLLPGAVAAGPPIGLHPDNPHYFLFRGRPTVLVGSTEHYGAVLNLDFDYVRYLDELHARGLNLTRTFSGVYCEDQRSFGIHGNPLAPTAGRLIAPWARSATPGYANGGNRFDLSQWDEAYFARCKDFVAQAGKRGIVVELVLFCPFYEDSLWKLSPMNAANNVNRIGGVSRTEVYTTRHPELLALHETLARKIVGELAGFDNVYFEVCNEPYFGGVTREWQYRIAAAIADAERGAPYRHLIAQNIANGSQRIERPAPGVSIFNFHYATPPDAVTANFGLNKAIADDETGFKGARRLHLPCRGLGFPPGRRRRVRQPRLLVHASPARRHRSAPRFRRRRAHASRPTGDPQELPGGLRFRQDDARSFRGPRPAAREGNRPRDGLEGAAIRGVRPRAGPLDARAGPSCRPIPGPLAQHENRPDRSRASYQSSRLTSHPARALV